MVTIDNSPVAPGSTVAQRQTYIPPATSGVTIQNTDTIEKLKNLEPDLLSTPNVWTATQTFPVASFANLLSTANTWTALQTFSAGINISEVQNTAAQTTITGTTAGSAIASMPEQGSSYKKAIVYLDSYENDSTTAQTYTFPVAFVNTPVISTNSASVPGVTVSTTELSLAPDTTTAYTGWIIIEGY